MIRKVVSVALAASLLAGCGVVGKSRPKTPVVGDRVSVLSTDPDVQVDPATAALPFSLPGAEVECQLEPGGRHPVQVGRPSRARHHAGRGVERVDRPGQHAWPRASAAPPVIAGGTVYTIDTTATVRAFDAATGGQRLGGPVRHREAATTPRCSAAASPVEGDRVFATNGLGFVAALERRHRRASCGRFARAARCAARRRWSAIRST